MRNTGSLCSDIKFFGLILDKKVILQHKLSGLHINQDLRGFLRVQNRGFLRFFVLKMAKKSASGLRKILVRIIQYNANQIFFRPNHAITYTAAEKIFTRLILNNQELILCFKIYWCKIEITIWNYYTIKSVS